MTAVPAADPDTTVLGSTLPRLWTPPLVTGEPGPCGCGCALTPETSYGFDVDDFARDVLGQPLDPWQRWLVIHAGELLPDGRPRFRTILAIIARQQGKSFLLRVLILYWLFVERQPMVLATSTDRSYAKAAWRSAVDTAKGNPHLRDELHARPTVEVTGDEAMRTAHGCTYRFAAVNRRAGRSLTINRLVLDEIREHRNFDAWAASSFATNAVPDAQIFAASNQGDSASVVLDSLRDAALTYLETGVGDPRTGLFEWSAPPGSDPTDLHALAQACPSLGRGRTDVDTLLGEARRVIASGDPEAVAKYRTEVMCQRVTLLDPAIDPDAWAAAGTDTPLDLAEHREQVALCVDVALDGRHAALLAAAVVDGRVHVEVVEAWAGPGCTKRLRDELPAIVARVRPRTIGWFPAGPAASVAAELAERKGRRDWPPRRVEVAEIRGDTAAVCMGLAEQVAAGQVVHPRDEMLDAHVRAAQRLYRGDAWVFGRKGSTAIDGTYALAGAVHLARTLRPAPAPLTAL